MTTLRNDILPEELTQEQVKVIVNQQFESIIDSSVKLSMPENWKIPRSRTYGAAKNIYEFIDLVHDVIKNYESRNKVSDDHKIVLTQEMPHEKQELESIVYTVEEEKPGQYSEGAPRGGDVRNLRPILREMVPDPDNPGYRKAILGYRSDYLVQFTCWSRTNKEANNKYLWFRDLMEDYSWYFGMRGVLRVIYLGKGPDKVLNTISGGTQAQNQFYGRPLDFFVQTEKLRFLSEKEIEQLIINVSVKPE